MVFSFELFEVLFSEAMRHIRMNVEKSFKILWDYSIYPACLYVYTPLSRIFTVIGVLSSADF